MLNGSLLPSDIDELLPVEPRVTQANLKAALKIIRGDDKALPEAWGTWAKSAGLVSQDEGGPTRHPLQSESKGHEQPLQNTGTGQALQTNNLGVAGGQGGPAAHKSEKEKKAKKEKPAKKKKRARSEPSSSDSDGSSSELDLTDSSDSDTSHSDTSHSDSSDSDSDADRKRRRRKEKRKKERDAKKKRKLGKDTDDAKVLKENLALRDGERGRTAFGPTVRLLMDNTDNLTHKSLQIEPLQMTDGWDQATKNIEFGSERILDSLQLDKRPEPCSRGLLIKAMGNAVDHAVNEGKMVALPYAPALAKLMYRHVGLLGLRYSCDDGKEKGKLASGTDLIKDCLPSLIVALTSQCHFELHRAFTALGYYPHLLHEPAAIVYHNPTEHLTPRPPTKAPASNSPRVPPPPPLASGNITINAELLDDPTKRFTGTMCGRCSFTGATREGCPPEKCTKAAPGKDVNGCILSALFKPQFVAAPYEASSLGMFTHKKGFPMAVVLDPHRFIDSAAALQYVHRIQNNLKEPAVALPIIKTRLGLPTVDRVPITSRLTYAAGAGAL